MAMKEDRPASIAVTFNVIQLINRLRASLKSRAMGFRRNSSLAGSDRRLDCELKTLQRSPRDVDAYLQSVKQWRRHPNRYRKHRRVSRAFSAAKLVNSRKVKCVLQSLDSNAIISHVGSPLSTVCSDGKLFLRIGKLRVEMCSVRQTIQLLMIVHDALKVLYAARTQFGDRFIVAQGEDLGLHIDEIFIANYEHLLLQYQSQLAEVLTRLLIEPSMSNDPSKAQRKQLSWFSEFPGTQRPLSTTWPWSIKPSLAVLWGVCWMFYDSPGRQYQAASRIPGKTILQAEQVRRWNPPQPNEYLNFGLELTGLQPQSTGDLDGSGVTSYIPGDDGGQIWEALEAPSQAGVEGDVSRVAQPQFISVHPGRAASGATSPTRPYYAQDILRAGHNHVRNYSVPGYSGIATQEAVPAFSHQQVAGNDFDESWPLAFPDTQAHLPPQPRHLINPVITVTGSTTAQPRAEITNVYPPQQPRLDPSFYTFASSPYDMANPSPPERSPIHTQNVVRKRTPSPNPHAHIRTPTSLADRPSPHLSPVMAREPSTVSSPDPARLPSEESSLQDPDDNDFTSGKQPVFKRKEEPPRDEHGKMKCKYKGCDGVTFDRKCEWSKHMDKHERPYKCQSKDCEKLRGFTYTGGLYRHQREVHNMHGGPQRQLLCPHQNCKRNSKPGFSRKENLAEHLRRVHKGDASTQSAATPVEGDTQEGVIMEDTGDRPVLQSEIKEDEEKNYSALKRKRSSQAADLEDADEADWRAEAKRLRTEVGLKNSELLQAQARVRELEAIVEQLKHTQR